MPLQKGHQPMEKHRFIVSSTEKHSSCLQALNVLNERLEGMIGNLIKLNISTDIKMNNFHQIKIVLGI